MKTNCFECYYAFNYSGIKKLPIKCPECGVKRYKLLKNVDILTTNNNKIKKRFLQKIYGWS